MSASIFDGAEYISVYTRAQAIEDGVLVDVSDTKEARQLFKWPVAMTVEAFGEYVRVPEGAIGQDVSGRLWDILFMLRHAIRTQPSSDLILFKVYVRNDNRPAKRVTLKSVCGPGDDGAPVVTIMLEGQD